MELDPRNPLLSLTFFCQGKSAEELRQMVICANVELQTVRIQAQEEMRRRDEDLRHFRSVLSKAVKERNEAQEKLDRLVKERNEAQEKLDRLVKEKFSYNEVKYAFVAPVSGVTSVEDEVKRGMESNNGFSSSEGDESIVSSPVPDPLPPPPLHGKVMMMQPMLLGTHEEMMELLVQEKRPLPEKGKLLDAVLNAGPLLQTLLLAGPLPQWRHPPPPLESSQIPPVAIPSPSPPPPPLPDYISIGNDCGRLSRKRGLMEQGSTSSSKTKYQKILLN